MKQLVTPPRVSREYETIFILRPDALDDERSKVIDRFEGIIDRLEGSIIKRDEWGKRKLAYRIRKHAQGIYYYYQYLGYGDLVPELERNLRILEPVLKYLTIKLEEEVDPEKRLAEGDKAAAAAAAAAEAPAAAAAEGADDGEADKAAD